MLRHNLLNLRLFIDEGAGELRELRELRKLRKLRELRKLRKLRRWGDGEMGETRKIFILTNSQFPIPNSPNICYHI
ncbi:MAG: hypothetical protein F6J92_18715 [Symploca sp. SIO1A3]|nr:hypothetical protein [Symploca sp. SIO1A3]